MMNKIPLAHWAHKHKRSFEVVCGVRNTSLEANKKILASLREAGLDELADLMALRIYQFMLDTDFGVEASGPPDGLIPIVPADEKS